MKFLTVLIMTLTGAIAIAASETGKGGGGINRNGKVLSFGSAKTVQVLPLDPREIPGLSEVQNGILDLTISEVQKARLVESVKPDSIRKYFKISNISAVKKAELIAEYQKAVVVNSSTIVILAVTDPIAKETYLLPEFFALNDSVSQAAILFHEGLWIVNAFRDQRRKALSYAEVIDLEMAFEKNLRERKFIPELYLGLAKVFGRKTIAFHAAAQIDMKSGALNGLALEDGTISLKDFVGQDFFDFFLTRPLTYVGSIELRHQLEEEGVKRLTYVGASYTVDFSYEDAENFALFTSHLANLIGAYPQSQWLRLIHNQRYNLKFRKVNYYIKDSIPYLWVNDSRFSITNGFLNLGGTQVVKIPHENGKDDYTMRPEDISITVLD